MTNTPQQQPPGWFYAEGDPPGTQRYWDGAQWQGDPRTVGASPVGGGEVAAGGIERAEVGSRLIAFLIDVGIFIGLMVVLSIVGTILGAISDLLGTLVYFLALLVYFGYGLYNWVFLQGTTGQTFGKKQQGISLLDSMTLQPLGAGGAFIRALVSWVFSIPCYLDSWWILIDEQNLRLSDKVLGNQVYKTPK